MKSRVSDNALNYLRDELDVTVDRIQQSLETYSEFPEDVSELRVASEYMDQLRGALVMADLEEGARFADEMRLTSEAICSESLDDLNLGRSALLDAALKLPPYLEALSMGHPDGNGLDLSGTMNTLRHARGASPSAGGAVDAMGGNPGTIDQLLVRRLRPSFQRALASVFRGREVPAQLACVDEVVSDLREMAQGETAYHLWWSCSKLVYALREGRAQVGPDTMRLLGGIDRLIKNLIDAGESGFDAGEIRNFVGGIEQALRDTGDGDLLDDRSDYDPPVAGSAAPRPDRETLRQIAANLSEDIALVQDAVDRLAHNDSADPKSRAAILESLHASAGVMSMLNMTAPAKLMGEQCKAIEASQALDRSHLEQLAADLVTVEDVISGMLNPKISRTLTAATEDSEPHLSLVKTAEARLAAVDQAIEDMRQVHDLATSFNWAEDKAGWQQVAPTLHRVANVFSILGDTRASGLVTRLLAITDHDGLGAVLTDQTDAMSALAEAVIGVEIYLEDAGPGGSEDDIHLAHSERRLAELERWLGLSPAAEDRGFDTERPSENASLLDGDALPDVDLDLELDLLADAVPTPALVAAADGASSVDADGDADADLRLDTESIDDTDLAVELDDRVEDGLTLGQDLGQDLGQETGLELADGSIDGVEWETGAESIPSADQSAAADVETHLEPDLEIGASPIADPQQDAGGLPGVEDETFPDSDPVSDTDATDSELNLDADGEIGDLDLDLDEAWQIDGDTEADPGDAESDLVAIDLDGAVEPDVDSWAESDADLLPDAHALTEADSDLLTDDAPRETAADDGQAALNSAAWGPEGTGAGPALGAGFAGAGVSLIERAVESQGTWPPEDASPDTAADDGMALDAATPDAGDDADLEVSTEPPAGDHADTIDGAVPESDDDGIYLETDNVVLFEAQQDPDDSSAVGTFAAGSDVDGANEVPGSDVEAASGEPESEGSDDLAWNGETTVATDDRLSAESAAPMDEVDLPDSGPVSEPDTGIANQQDTSTLSGATDEAWTEHEFLDIFLEEAQGELEQLRATLPILTADLDDLESLQTVRRSFHTLKGSGRMVGALMSGDFAWAIEDVLNRVLDGRSRITPELPNLLTDCVDAYEEIIAEMQQGRSGAVDAALFDRIELYTTTVDGSDAPQVEEIGPESEDIESHDESLRSAVDAGDPSVELVESSDKGSSDEAVETADSDSATDGPDIAAGQPTPETQTDLGPLRALSDRFQTGGADPEPLLDLVTEVDQASADLLEDRQATLLDTVAAYLQAATSAGQVLTDGDMDLLRAASDELLGATESRLAGNAHDSDADDLIGRLQALGDSLAGSTAGLAPATDPEPAGVAAPTQPESLLDPELVEVFAQEGADILDSADVILDRWSREPDNPDLLADLRREMHTLKGSSRMAGFLVIGDLAHGVESLLDDISRGRVTFTDQMGEVLQRALDGFHTMLGVARELEQPDPATALIEDLARCATGAPEAGEPDRKQSRDEGPAEPVQVPVRSPSADAVMLVPEASDMVRVNVDLLDHVADQMGESSIYRSRIQQCVSDYDFQLHEMDQVVGRLSEKLRRLEIETEAQILFRYERGSDDQFEDFDPLELDRFSELQQLSRSLMEVINDLGSIRITLGEQTRELEALLHQQGKVNHDIQEGLSRTRMVRFDSIVPRMRRVVRQAADELGKRAELTLEGGGEMERSLLEHVVAPMEHILRNAVAHGIELPAERMAGGKSEAGHITLDMRREGSELVLSVKDDGAGVNFDAVRGKAEKAGLLEPGSSVTRDELIDCLMQPGFSTADQINQVAGRGVGMDVVVEAVRAAGGSLSIESEPNLGTTFIIRLPFSLSITQALLFTAGGQTFAAPLAGVESMCRLEAEEVRAYLENGRGTVNVAGVDYDIHSLGALLGGSAPQSDDMDRHLPAMLIRSEGMNVALQVDEVLGSEEIVVKPVGPQVNSVPGLSGATILGDGRVVLILETAALVRNFVGRRSDEEAAAIREALRGSTEAPLKIMVIDDSITMRKVTSRLLERHGIDALLAKDGLDAAGQLEDVVPDAVVLDIEMPRMDGFELAAHIRNQEHLWHMPIIMVTSRSGEKHRQRAMDLGVNAYLGKPYREEELLSALRQVLGPRGERIPLQ